ncbi:MAG TPA: hydrogenase iron-sulfur subunit [Chitinivibrionales bacterium]
MTAEAAVKSPEAIIYLCRNCFPGLRLLPAQWSASGIHVRVKEIPCSGKIDAQYILHGFEGGVLGVCIVTCAKGKCTLSQGNYRAEIRINTVRRLLEEIGSDPGRVELIRATDDEQAETIRQRIDQAIQKFSALIGTARLSA